MSTINFNCDYDGKNIETVSLFLPNCSYCVCSEHLFSDLIKPDCIFYEHLVLEKPNIECKRCKDIQSESKTVIKCLICDNHQFSLKECLSIPKSKAKIKEFIFNKKTEQLIKMLDELETIKKDPKNFINDLYKEITNKINLQRDLIEAKIEEYYNKLINTIKADQQNKLRDLSSNLNSINFDSLRQKINLIKDQTAKETNTITRNKVVEENIKQCEDLMKKFNYFEKVSNRLKEYDLFIKDDHLNVEEIFGKLIIKEDKKLYEIVSTKCSKTLEGHSNSVTCVEKLENGDIISSSEDGTLKIWNKETGSCIKSIQNTIHRVLSFILSNNNEIISSSYKIINIYNKSTGDLIKSIDGHINDIFCLQILENGDIISASFDRTIKIWDRNSGNCLKVLQGHTGGVYSIHLINNEELLSCSADQTIKLWNIKTGNCIKTYQGHKNEVRCIKSINENEFISASDDNTIKIWNKNTGNCLKTLTGHSAGVTSLRVVSKTGEIVTSSRDGKIKIWDKESGECMKTLEGHTDEVWYLEVFNNNEIISASKDKTIKIWK